MQSRNLLEKTLVIKMVEICDDNKKMKGPSVKLFTEFKKLVSTQRDQQEEEKKEVELSPRSTTTTTTTVEEEETKDNDRVRCRMESKYDESPSFSNEESDFEFLRISRISSLV